MRNREIHELMKQVKKLNLAEVSVEMENFKLTIRTHEPGGQVYTVAPQVAAAPMPVAAAAPPPATASAPAAVAPPKAAASDANLITIKSPMIGTFYRASGPDKPSCVNVGDEITTGTVLCIIEAMKLFNEIESEQSGRIVKILVENAQPVEYDQPLFLIEAI